MVMLRKPRIDFKKYRQRRYLVAVFMEFGKGRWWEGMSYSRTFCPLCHYDSKRAARMGWWNFAAGFYHCHNCKETRDAIGMVCYLLKVDAVDACKWLEEKAGAADSGLVAEGTSNIRRPPA